MSNAADRAEALFLEGYTCSQAVTLSLCEQFGVPSELAARLALGLGGGIGRLREVCGAVSAMATLAGLKYGDSAPNPDAKKRTYAIVRTMAEEFRASQGTILCREILGLAPGEAGGDPEPRTPEYYARREKCLACIRAAAAIAEKNVLLG